MNKSVLVGLLVLVLVAIGAGGWFYISGQNIGGGATAASGQQASGDGPVVTPDDKFIGKADAPVTIVEYFSLGCPHCKNFHENTLPKLKTEYIDTGKARLVFRDFPLDGVAGAAALLTHCVNDLAYFAMVDTVFAQQDVWHVQGGVAQLANIAKSAGLDQAAFDACLADQARKDKITAGQKEAADKFEVEATPTFFVNGKKVGAGDYDAMKQAIDAALAAQ